MQRFGRLDVMVNNAGVEHKMPFLDTPLDVWEEVLAVNLTGPWLGCQEAARQMVGQGGRGRIINVSSVHEDLAMPTNSPYCAAKGGLRMLTRTIAWSGRRTASPSTTLPRACPGRDRDPHGRPAGGERRPDVAKLLSEIPLGRMGHPEEVAALWPCIWPPTPPT